MPLTGTPVVRYYFDEGSVTTVVDRSGNGYDLTDINTGSGNLTATTTAGQRAFDSSAATGVQRTRRQIAASDALQTALDGVQKVTMEVVITLDGTTSNGSRIFGINGRAGQNGTLMLRCSDTVAPFDFMFGWEDTVVNTLQIALAAGTRTVIHVVIDTTQAVNVNRVRVYFDGVDQGDPSTTGIMAQNDTLTVPTAYDLIAFNRESSGAFERSWDGRLHYAALYAAAFTQADVTNNSDILTLNDDLGRTTRNTLAAPLGSHLGRGLWTHGGSG